MVILVKAETIGMEVVVVIWSLFLLVKISWHVFSSILVDEKQSSTSVEVVFTKIRSI